MIIRSCDGSDEINGPRECENTCEEDGAQWRDEQAKKIKLVEQGKSTLVSLDLCVSLFILSLLQVQGKGKNM